MSEEENCKDKNFGSKNQHIHTQTPTNIHTHVQREQISSIYFCLCVDSLNKTKKKGTCFPIWLRNRLISDGLEPVLSQTEKSCRAISTNIKIKII